jgi:hypothetical protein
MGEVPVPVEADKWIFEHGVQLLQLLGVTSLAGFIALYAAWLKFPPEILIEAVSDKSKKLNSESRIKIKNSGKLPALKIETEIEQLNATIGGIQLRNCAIKNSPSVIPRLSAGETTEISVSPGVATEHGVEFSAFSYVLKIRCHARLFLIKRTFAKTWKVELRNFEDGYTWNTTIMK